jgi:hypothetical protein
MQQSQAIYHQKNTLFDAETPWQSQNIDYFELAHSSPSKVVLLGSDWGCKEVNNGA